MTWNENKSEVFDINKYSWWQSDRSLDTYQQMLEHFKTARTPDKGKPVNHNWRLFKDGDTIRIEFQGYGTHHLADVTPDNIITFVATENHMLESSHSYVASFYRWFPFVVNRHRKGLYRIRSTKNLDNEINIAVANETDDIASDSSWYGGGVYSTFNSVMNSGPAYFKGIQFNLLTGECLNQKTDDEFIEIPAKRKEWRQTLTAYKKGLKARAKVHALDAIALDIIKERDNQTANKPVQGYIGYNWNARQPDWSSEKWLDSLHKNMVALEFPKHLLKGFVETSIANNGWRNRTEAPTVNELYITIDKIFTDLSIPLRRRFKVFQSEGYDERIEEKHFGGYQLDDDNSEVS